MSEFQNKYFSPRLVDYVIIVGTRHPNHNNNMAQTPELLRRYPIEDHSDFPLPPDVIFFCQPEGCISIGPKRMSLRETTSFVYTLTEKDSGRIRYGICVNFFRPIERKSHSMDKSRTERCLEHTGSTSSGDGSYLTPPISDSDKRSPRTRRKQRKSSIVRNNTLTSLCIISHHPFFSTFRECLFILRRLIDACHDRSCTKRIGGSKGSPRENVWGVLTGQGSDGLPSLVLHEVREIETWILRLLSAPVSVPGKTRVEVQVLPRELQPPLIFALPDHTRFSLVDFPLHLPLELLGVDMCLKVLTCIILEHKIIMQSRDYNALTMSVIAFVSMLYPLEYMFPIIPLLPTCMSSAEQLLLAPTPYIIGVPSSFLLYRKDFRLPDDVWVIDLDSNKITVPITADELPVLPEPEATVLKNHLKQALASMSMTPQPIKNLDILAQNPEMWKRRESFSSQTGFNPLIYGNDVDSVDVATRVAMIRFFNSPNILGNFCEHTRTLRLYPRPVVAFQVFSFLKSRPVKTYFTAKLARTQAVEYFGEWSLCPKNVVFLRVQTAVFDPLLIGDKPKWYAHHLQPIEFHVYDEQSSLGAAIMSAMDNHSDDNPTDESGSDSDGADSTSSSYSSLSDFVTDIVNSEIDGDTPAFCAENQVLHVDHSKVFTPPSKLTLPDSTISNSDSAFSMPESDASSDESSSPTYSQDVPRQDSSQADSVLEQSQSGDIFRYDSGNVTPTKKVNASSIQPENGAANQAKQPTLQPLNRSLNSAFEAYEKPVVPPARPPPPVRREGSVSLSVSSSSSQRSSTTSRFRKTSELKSHSDSDRSSTSSFMSTLSSELTDIAHTTTNTLSELFGNKTATQTSKQNKPFAPLGNRKALVEKSGLVKHANNKKTKDTSKQQTSDSKSSTSTTNSENQQFLKEIIASIFDGQGISFFKLGRMKKLLEDENYRNFVVSRLNKNLDKKLTDDNLHLEDVPVSKQVFRGMSTMLKALVHGLEMTYQNHGLGGMASAFVILEIAHTHYWARDMGLNRGERSITPEVSSPYGSRESLTSKDDESPKKPDAHSLHEENMVAALGSPHSKAFSTPSAAGHAHTGWWAERPKAPSAYLSEQSSSSQSTESGSPVIVNGDEFENIVMQNGSNADRRSENNNIPDSVDLKKNSETATEDENKVTQSGITERYEIENLRNNHPLSDRPCDIIVTQAEPGGEKPENTDMLRDMVKNKELIATNKLDKKFSSIDSEISEASTLVSTSSDNPNEEHRKKSRINHHTIRGTLSDSEMELSGVVNYGKRNRSPSIRSNKSNLSTGYCYHDGKLVNTSPLPSQDTSKTYLFENLLGKERTRLWDQMQFWEDVYLDAVAQERDIIGMDQGPGEMIERYNSLGDVEKKRLEHDEDKLLSVILYNMVGFMVMMNINQQEVKRKIRRLIGKSHVGLQYSGYVNNLLDEIHNLRGNDIDLQPMGSRLMQKQSFTVHWGPDNTGDMLFMEVCDDCIILRSVTGAICDRWWYEKLVNMTYCPKTKVLCLWRKTGEKVQLNQFYTKKCRELYFCVKEAMDKAAARNNGKVPGPELGGEFPVQDLKSGQGGLLQVCMEGIGLLLANSKFFIELCHVRKCFTQKGGIFVLEEFDPQTQKVIHHKYRSKMADEICYSVLCVFSYIAAGLEQKRLT